MTKNLKILYATAIIASAMPLSSCGSKGLVVRADDYDAETIVDLMNEEEPVVNVPVHSTKPQEAAKKTVVNTPLDGEWMIIKAGDKDINEDYDMPYVIFSDKEGKFYASNGCNVINGSFDYKSNNTLTFSNTITTIRECPDITYQKDINLVLNNYGGVRTQIEDKGRETYLYILSNDGKPLMTLRRHNLEALNGQWEVEYIGNEEVDGSEINLFFDVPERSIHGNTGCNYFNGVIVITPDKASSISFAQMGVTMKYCDNADIERKLLVALEETEGYVLKDAQTLYLTDSDGKTLITLKHKTL